VAKERDALFKEGALRRLNLKAHTMKAGKNSVEAYECMWIHRTSTIFN